MGWEIARYDSLDDNSQAVRIHRIIYNLGEQGELEIHYLETSPLTFRACYQTLEGDHLPIVETSDRNEAMDAAIIFARTMGGGNENA